jgi:hypothetical protein
MIIRGRERNIDKQIRVKSEKKERDKGCQKKRERYEGKKEIETIKRKSLKI